MNKKKVDKIFKQLEAGYDEMSEKFSETRKFFWRDLEFIADYVKDGDKILDYGCGNGRLLEILKGKKISYTGVDISGKLIGLANQKYKGKNIKFEKISSQDSLSFPDNYFNDVISVAVFHHFPLNYAKKIAEELFRITNKKGHVILTIWNLKQERFGNFMKQESGDLYIPFKNNEGKIFRRYHNLFTKRDIGEIFSKAGFKIKKLEIVNGKNILLIGEKKE